MLPVLHIPEVVDIGVKTTRDDPKVLIFTL